MQAFEINGKRHLPAKHVLLRFLTAPFVFLVERLFQNIVRFHWKHVKSHEEMRGNVASGGFDQSLSRSPFLTSKRFAGLKIYALLLLLGGMLSSNVQGQTLIRWENFETLNNTSQATWSVSSGASFNSSNNGIVLLTCTSTTGGVSNTTSGIMKDSWSGSSPAANPAVFVTSTTGIAPYVRNNLTTNSGLVVWAFNFKWSGATAPGGCISGRNGITVEFANTSGSIGGLTSGNKYAVTYGDAFDASSTNAKLQLVAVADGANYSARTLICGSTGTLAAAVGGGATVNGYYSCKVVYNADNDNWSLYARYDGASAFKDPMDGSAAFTQIGSTALNTTFTSSIDMRYYGVNTTYNAILTSGTEIARYDNFYLFHGIGAGSAAGSMITVVSPQTQSTTTVPSLTGFTGGASTTNKEQYYYVFGNTLGANNMTVAPPSGLEIGSDPAGSFTTSSLTLTPVNGHLAAKIYVRPSSTSAASGTINHTCAGASATAKTISVTQAPLGSITATGVSISAQAASQPMTVSFVNAGTTLTGKWNAAQDLRAPTVTASMANNTATCGFAAATTTKNYVAQDFQVSATGSYTFTMRTSAIFDGAGYIVTGAFVPGTCPGTGTWLTGSDGGGTGEPVLGPVTLTAGVTYTLISTSGAAASGSLTSYSISNGFVWDITAPVGEQIRLPFVQTGNRLTGNWSANNTSTGNGPQQNETSLRNTTANNSSTPVWTTSTTHNYVTRDFEVSADGNYTFTMALNSSYNGHGYIVRHTPQGSTGPIGYFFGTTPNGTTQGGTFIWGDDNNGEATMTNVPLTAGTLYTLVSSAIGAESAVGHISNAFSWSVTGEGNVLTPVNGQLQWYTAASGGSPIGYGGSFDPVGVAGSGLANTNTAGTTTYYVAFSGWPNNRTAVDFVIVAAAACTPPNGTAGLSFSEVTATSTTVNANYTNGANLATGYVLLRNTTNTAPTAPASGTAVPTASSSVNWGGTYTVLDATTTLGSSVSFSSSSLTCNTPYYYWVVAYQNTSGPCWFTPTHSGNIQTTSNNTAGAASSTQTVLVNTALTSITHTTTGATGISQPGVSGANTLPAGVSASWTNNLITISGTPTSAATFAYSIPLTGGCGSVNATGTITVVDAYTWNGSTSSAWNTAANWTPNGVPTAANNVKIPASPTNELEVLSSLTIDANATFTLQSNAKLTLSGNITNNGTLTIGNGATLVQTGSGANANTGSGTYNVKQYVTGSSGTSSPNGRFWYLGSPLSNASSSALLSNNNLLWQWNEGSFGYSSVTSGSLEQGRSYVLRSGQNDTLNFSGTGLSNGTVTVSGLTRTGTAHQFRGCHLVSNPYPSYLDWDMVGKTNVSTTMYVRTASNSSIDVLETYNSANQQGTNISTPSTPLTNFIAPMQGFWVKVETDGQTGSLSMTNAMRSHQAGYGLRSTPEDFPAYLRFNMIDGLNKDQVILLMSPNATAGLDDHDSEKMSASGYAQFYSTVNAKKLVINGMKNVKAKTSVPLTLVMPTSKSYTFQAEEFNIEDGLILLEDKQENVIQDLTINPTYAFFGNAGTNATRFVVHFQLASAPILVGGPQELESLGSEDLTTDNIQIISNNQGTVTIRLDEGFKPEGNIRVFDASGRLLEEIDFKEQETTIHLNGQAGMYFVEVSAGKLMVKKKIVIN